MENDEMITDGPDEGLDDEITVCGVMWLHAGAA